MPVTVATILAFAAVCVGLVLTPGPNMIYLISRTLTQGLRAGFVSLGGTVLGFVVHIAAAVSGLAAIAVTAPLVYDGIRYAGAAYLLWLAWESIRPGGQPLFAPRPLAPASDSRLFMMGLMTSILNPKVALFYLSLLPQFVTVSTGSILVQMLILAAVQVVVSIIGNSGYILGAGAVARFFATRPGWVAAQRWVMGLMLAGLALRLAIERR